LLVACEGSESRRVEGALRRAESRKMERCVESVEEMEWSVDNDEA
jgi:hypothetical protein